MKGVEALLGNIGKNIRVLRTAKKISQKEMATKAGISVSQYQRMETGAINTTIATLIKIASLLNVGIDLLVYGEEAKKENEHIALAEKDLIEKMKELESMNPEDKKLAHRLLDLIIAKKHLNELVKQMHKGR